MKVKLAAGIVQVLQLDDCTLATDGRREYAYDAGPIRYRHSANGKWILVEGEPPALRQMARHCHGAEEFCGAPWYARSAAAARAVLEQALATVSA